jgi:hypothetical protein
MLAFIEYLLVKACMSILIPILYIMYICTKHLRSDHTNERVIAEMKKLWEYKTFDERL